MAVLMLQSLAVERRTPGCRAAQEASAARVGEGPDEIAYALESEHRIEDVEGDHLDPVIRVRRSGRGERTHRTGFGDAFFEYLTVLGFLVVEEHVGVVRLVELSLAGVDAHLAEERFHTEGARLVGDDRHYALADGLIFQQVRQDADESHGCRNLAPFGARELL